mmetsp:Transcript_1586/g.4145  ORF Transcript_1586/g.4145 Transcript_1586/m.4145 type:complete len:200 (-) Transcript_1586:199-798(-)
MQPDTRSLTEKIERFLVFVEQVLLFFDWNARSRILDIYSHRAFKEPAARTMVVGFNVKSFGIHIVTRETPIIVAVVEFHDLCSKPDESLVDKFDTVPAQVQKDLLEPQDIRFHGYILRAVNNDLNLAFAVSPANVFSSSMEHSRNGFQDVLQQIGRSKFHLELLACGSIHVEHVAQEVVDKVQCMVHDLDILPGLKEPG